MFKRASRLFLDPKENHKQRWFNGVDTIILAGVMLSGITGCAVTHRDSLASWNEGATWANITGFIERLTTKGDPGLTPPMRRIAVFNNDDTLWSEQPVYSQLLFALDRKHQLVPRHLEWRAK